MQSDVFADDEVVGKKGVNRQLPPALKNVERVVDTTAETLAIQFERFLEKYETLREHKTSTEIE